MDETSLPLASVPTPVKRPRGRPPKVSLPGSASAAPAQPKRPRGRPRKYATVDEKNAAQRERARRIREMKQRDQEEGISVLEAQAILESFDVDVDVDDEMEGTEMSVGEDAERSSDGDSVFGPTGANITQVSFFLLFFPFNFVFYIIHVFASFSFHPFPSILTAVATATISYTSVLKKVGMFHLLYFQKKEAEKK